MREQSNTKEEETLEIIWFGFGFAFFFYFAHFGFGCFFLFCFGFVFNREVNIHEYLYGLETPY